MEKLNKSPEELELKYIVSDNEEESKILERLMTILSSSGYKVISTTKKTNNDEYFDSRNLSLYLKGGSLRIRKTTQNGKVKIKGTYKNPLNKKEVYYSRTEIEEILPEDTFEAFEAIMVEKKVDFSEIIKVPILNSTTQRTDIILEKDGIRMCLSFDNVTYTNHFSDESKANDRMIEIEAVGKADKGTLDEVHSLVTTNMNNLTINKQSKYERGINQTINIWLEQKSGITKTHKHSPLIHK